MYKPSVHFTPELKQQFIELFPKYLNVQDTATALCVSARNVFTHMDKDPAFREAVESIRRNELMEELEVEAKRRALKGSDTLLIFLMKGNRPDKYRDNSPVTINNQNIQGIKEIEVHLSSLHNELTNGENYLLTGKEPDSK